jgi:hypothetical protein
MVADMTIGVVECVFCTLIRCDSLEAVAELAKKKIIMSPLHHLILVITSLADSAFIFVLWNSSVLSARFWLVLPTEFVSILSSPLIAGVACAQSIHSAPFPFKLFLENKMLHTALQTSFVVKAAWDLISLLSKGHLTALKIVVPIAITSLYWTYYYTFGQRMIGSFSPSWNHQAFSIFRDQGAPVKAVGTRFLAEEPDPNKTFQDLAFSDCSTAFWEAHSPKFFEAHKSKENRLPSGASAAQWNTFWKNFIGKDRGKINPSNAHEKKLYNQFRDGILAGKPATELLKLPQNASKSEVEKAYKTYSLVLHSDRNPTRLDEATVLFKCLTQAKFQLIND